MKSFLSLISLVLLISSCSGKKEGNTSASIAFKLGALVDMSVMGGNGAKFYGKSDNGDSFMMDIPSDGNISGLSLRNGTWKFYAMTWEDVGQGSDKFTGKVRCAMQSAVLAGNDVSLNFSLTNAACGDEVNFGPTFSIDHDSDPVTPNIIRFAEIEIYPLLEPYTASAFNICHGPDGSQLNCEASVKDIGGVTSSYKLTIGNYTIENSVKTYADTSPIEICADVTGTMGMAEFFELNIPKQLPFHLLKVGFNGSCAASSVTDIEEINRMDGSHASMGADFSIFISGTNNEKIRIFHKNSYSLICKSDIDDSTVLRGETDKPVGWPSNNTYAICNSNQFNSIGNDTIFTSARILLINDIDMSSDTSDKSLICDGRLYPMSTIKPIGAEYDPNNDCELTEAYPSNDFTGVFDGLGHTIRNARLEVKSSSPGYGVGIFRVIGSGGVIKNVTIENVEVQSNMDDVGILAGKSLGTSALKAKVENIKIFDSRIDIHESSQYVVGGLIGYAAYTTVSQAILGRVDIRGNSSVGGIIGESSDGTNIVASAFLGKIESESNYTSNTGGIVGYMGGYIDSFISHSFSVGAVTSRGTTLGGIAGYLASGSSISNSYTKSLVMAQEHHDPSQDGGPLNLGGIAGYSNGSINNSMSMGAIVHRCQTMGGSSTPECEIGDIVGGNYGTISQVGALDSVNESAFSNYSDQGVSDDLTVTQMLDLSFINATLQASQGWAADWNGSTTPIWKMNNGGFPFLAWETNDINPCINPENLLSVASQVSSGRGSSDANPVKLCIPSQLNDMRNYSAFKYFKQLHPIIVGNMSPATASFGGIFDGNDLPLIGGKLITNSSVNLGFFQRIASGAIIENAKFIGFKIDDSLVPYAASQFIVSNASVGVVAGTNDGTITNTKVNDSEVIGDNNIGLMVGVNNGLIEESQANGSMVARVNAGSIAGFNSNTGIISRVKSHSHIENRMHTNNGMILNAGNFGGIVGQNSGGINSCRFGGELYLAVQGTTQDSFGGIVGRNNDFDQATVKDCVVGDPWGYEQRDTIRVEFQNGAGSGDINYVGGAIGKNLNPDADALTNIVIIGKISINTVQTGGVPDMNARNDIGPILGYSAYGDGSELTRTYYMYDTIQNENNISVTQYTIDATNGIINYYAGPDLTAVNYIKVLFQFGGMPQSIVLDQPSNSYTASQNTFVTSQDLYSLPYFDYYNGDKLLFIDLSSTGNSFGTLKTDDQLKTIGTFCPEWAGISDFTGDDPLDSIQNIYRDSKCTNGFDIAQMEGAAIGFGRIMDTYMGISNPKGAPVWTIDEGMRFPSPFDLE